jgi:hypothetical protein
VSLGQILVDAQGRTLDRRFPAAPGESDESCELLGSDS